MKLLRLVIIFLVSISLIVLSGCKSNSDLSSSDKTVLNQLESGKYKSVNVETKEYKRKRDVISKSEPIEIKWEEINMSKAKFWFDSDIDMKSRKSYIEQSLDILTELNKRYNKDKKFNFYISDKVISHNEKNKVYVKYINDKYDSTDFIIQALYRIFGDTSNYGLLYGEATDIQKTLKIYEKNDFNYDKDYIEKQIKKYPYMMDLSLASFSDYIYNSLDLDYIKLYAEEFVSFVKDKYGDKEFINLIEISSDNNLDYDDKFVEYMNEYLKNKDLNLTKEKETFAFRYKIFNDTDFPICICTDWMKYCIGSKSYSMNGYSSMNSMFFSKYKEIIEHWDKNMGDVRKYLNIGLSKDDCKELYTYITNGNYITNLSVWAAGYCDVFNKYIYCNDVTVYLHEYTHYVTLYDKKDRNISVELLEGIADYCEYKFEDYTNYNISTTYGTDKYNRMYNINMKNIYDKYLDSIGITTHNKDVFEDFDRKMDYIELFYYTKYLENDKIMKSSNRDVYPYVYGSAYTKYLIDNYGIDKYMEYFNYCDKNNFYDVFGVYKDRLQDDFIEYLKNKYDKFVK